MKKQLTAVFLIFALLLTLSGCMAANAVQQLDMVEDKVEAKLDTAEDKLEESLRNAVAPAPPAAPAEPAVVPAPAESEPAPTAPAAVPEKVPAVPAQEPAAPEKLTQEQALQVALDHLGFQADQISRLRTEFEIDDGIPQYDIEFHQGDWEYEFEIHGENGKIISYDKDHKYD